MITSDDPALNVMLLAAAGIAALCLVWILAVPGWRWRRLIGWLVIASLFTTAIGLAVYQVANDPTLKIEAKQ